jgi:hypothetical protein
MTAYKISAPLLSGSISALVGYCWKTKLVRQNGILLNEVSMEFFLSLESSLGRSYIMLPFEIRSNPSFFLILLSRPCSVLIDREIQLLRLRTVW